MHKTKLDYTSGIAILLSLVGGLHRGHPHRNTMGDLRRKENATRSCSLSNTFQPVISQTHPYKDRIAKLGNFGSRYGYVS